MSWDEIAKEIVRLRERVALLEAKVEALERLPRPAVTVFREPNAYDRRGPLHYNDPRTND
jgi:hypothetical protein